ncbi:hypothetical protein FA13DRAFT_1110903 [Coprinellus micaceus]|uniref:Uncharacterized protein n=1 Tax=Coprinellus micaceus TaxID=71717 RepID=A0A4Y7SW39_COPMI|nr:hypothetical protein FA13DRAFT_1110903 [Coprinellus micaceus]
MAACPVHTLSDDLLSEIFLLCLPMNRWETSPKPSQPPTVLTLVCKRWRRVALAFPSLWRWMQLHVFSGRTDEEGVARTMARFEDILKLSLNLRPFG